MPAPAGALLALPLMVSFEIEAARPRHALVVGTVLVVVGGLMVSRLPTFSFKKGRVPRHLVLPALLGAALMMGVIASSPWIGLSLLGLVYVALIPYSWLTYRRQALVYGQASGAAVVNLRAVNSGSPTHLDRVTPRCSIQSCGGGSTRPSTVPAPGLRDAVHQANAASLAIAIGLLVVPLLAYGHYEGGARRHLVEPAD